MKRYKFLICYILFLGIAVLFAIDLLINIENNNILLIIENSIFLCVFTPVFFYKLVFKYNCLLDKKNITSIFLYIIMIVLTQIETYLIRHIVFFIIFSVVGACFIVLSTIELKNKNNRDNDIENVLVKNKKFAICFSIILLLLFMIYHIVIIYVCNSYIRRAYDVYPQAIKYIPAYKLFIISNIINLTFIIIQIINLVFEVQIIKSNNILDLGIVHIVYIFISIFSLEMFVFAKNNEITSIIQILNYVVICVAYFVIEIFYAIKKIKLRI